jgi:sigma-B regulation protein RsbU (phosphoserine phosphatase)
VDPGPSASVALRSLVGHTESVPASAPLEEVHRHFAASTRDFLAVLDGPLLLGVCARREIAMLLGARFGFALFARQPVRERVMPDALRLAEGEPLPAVLERVSARNEEHFYDDVLLVNADGGFLGFIFVHALVRLQTRLVLANMEALERSRRVIAEKNQAMEEDLQMAREIQIAMLPAAAAEPGVAWGLQSRYLPAAGVSGDFFQLIRISDAAAGLLVCDVMGHGVRSALVTAMLRAFAEELRSEAQDPGRLLTRLNHGLMGVLRQSGNLIFVTAAYVVVDVAAGQLRYGQAGHPTGFLRRASGAVELLPAGGDVAGPALGLIEDAEYVTAVTVVGRGDAAMLFTDGLPEARAADGDEWGEEAMRREVERDPAAAHGEVLARVVAAAQAFAAGRPFDDDVCIVALEALL